MSRDRQIAVLASIVGLAGLIIGIVAMSQVSGADDEWVRNRALPVAASSEESALQTQAAVQEVEDLRERVAELEKSSVPAKPEEVAPTVELPTEETEAVDSAETRSTAPATTLSFGEETAPSSAEETAPSSVEETTIDSPIGVSGYNNSGDSGSEFKDYSSGGKLAIDAPIGVSGFNNYGDSDSEFQDYPWKIYPRSRPAYIDTRYPIRLNRADTQEALLEVVDNYASNDGMRGESSTPKPGVKFIDDRYLRLEIQCNAEHLRVWLYPHRVNLAGAAMGHVIMSPSYYGNGDKVYPSTNFRTRMINLYDSNVVVIGGQTIYQDTIPKLILDIPFSSYTSGDGNIYYGTHAYSDTYLLLKPEPMFSVFDNSAMNIHLRGKTDGGNKTCEVSYTGIFGHETLTEYGLACWWEPDGCGP